MNIYSPIEITEEIRRKFKPTRLYIKELAGIKYFGKTSNDPYLYSGSGKIWKDRIKKYGEHNIKTLWVSDVYYSPDELQNIALHFSRENRIVESNNWANLKPENGLDGGQHTKTIIQKMKNTKEKNGTTNPFTDDSRKKGLETKLKKYGTTNLFTPESRKKGQTTMLEKYGVTHHARLEFHCGHCNRDILSKGMFTRWHGDNCRENPNL